jgi:hypothetical protein
MSAPSDTHGGSGHEVFGEEPYLQLVASQDVAHQQVVGAVVTVGLRASASDASCTKEDLRVGQDVVEQLRALHPCLMGEGNGHQPCFAEPLDLDSVLMQ